MQGPWRQDARIEEEPRLMDLFLELRSRLCEDEGLKSILGGKSLTGEYLKPSEPEFDAQVLPHGSHVVCWRS